MMWRFALASLLAGLALTLAGCGGGSNAGGGGAAADLVSQSLVGSYDVEGTQQGHSASAKGDSEFYLDMEKMNMRWSVPHSGSGVDGRAEVLLDAAHNKAYLSVDVTVNGTRVTNCSFVEVTQQELQFAKLTVQNRLKSTKPVGMDGDYRKFEIAKSDIPIPQGLPVQHGNFDMSVSLDDSNVLHKFELNVDGQDPRGGKMTSRITFQATKATGGAPDPSHFEVPKSWQHCQQWKPPQPGSWEISDLLLQWVSRAGRAQTEVVV
jgi:hypothetical protein